MVVKDMRKVHIIILCLLAAALIPITSFAKITASIDRNSMALDETLSLTLTKDGTSFFTQPDLQPLENNFKILGQNQSSMTQIINGSATSSVEWQINLSPRRTGNLEIPSITVGKEHSNSLTVQVRKATQPKTKAENVPIFIETDVDADSVYVQSQLIFTLRLFWAVEARITEPSDPQLANALLRRLDDTTYDKMLNGGKYKVFERKYAIFPQKSGTLEIPSQVIEVTVPSRQRSYNFFDPFTNIGEKIKLRSDAKSIQVKEKPPEFPKNAAWLPASTIILKEQWNTNDQKLTVGESTTVTITLTADGLTGEQLPPITLPESDGLKLYQGKADVDNNMSAAGVVGIRKESVAIIPTKAGTYELPEIRIPWWDKEQNKIDYAIIPGRKLTVEGTAVVSKIDEKPVSIDERPIVKEATPAATKGQALDGKPPTFWILLCTALATGWLITLFLFIRTRKNIRLNNQNTQQKIPEDIDLNEKQAYSDLSRACKKNDPVTARKTALTWLRTYLPEAGIQTFSDAAKVVDAPELIVQLNELDKFLYKPAELAGQWQGGNLIEKVKKLRSAKSNKSKEKNVLEKLYK